MKPWKPGEIKQLRSGFNLTQQGLADLLGVTRTYIGLLERNEKTPSKTLKLLLNCVEKDLSTSQNEKENGKGGKDHGNDLSSR
jgi:DNA-binding transcriptional regulator YiaG